MLIISCLAVFWSLLDSSDYKVLSVCSCDMDVLFLVDGSYSVSEDEFAQAKELVMGVVQAFQSNTTRIGFWQFSDVIAKVARLTPLAEGHGLNEKIKNCAKLKSATYTGAALKEVRTSAFVQGNDARRDVAHVVVLVTDGLSSDERSENNVFRQAENMKTDGLALIAVGVNVASQSQSQVEFNKLGYNGTYIVEKYSDLSGRMVALISEAVCKTCWQFVKYNGGIIPDNVDLSKDREDCVGNDTSGNKTDINLVSCGIVAVKTDKNKVLVEISKTDEHSQYWTHVLIALAVFGVAIIYSIAALCVFKRTRQSRLNNWASELDERKGILEVTKEKQVSLPWKQEMSIRGSKSRPTRRSQERISTTSSLLPNRIKRSSLELVKGKRKSSHKKRIVMSPRRLSKVSTGESKVSDKEESFLPKLRSAMRRASKKSTGSGGSRRRKAKVKKTISWGVDDSDSDTEANLSQGDTFSIVST